ncbi:hypothetical protein FQN54_005080 [Arachnomyces sp. PD_36]|nr:hypothetical protein FQN54_005080 [Arachnomyces sp. PD_36]
MCKFFAQSYITTFVDYIENESMESRRSVYDQDLGILQENPQLSNIGRFDGKTSARRWIARLDNEVKHLRTEDPSEYANILDMLLDREATDWVDGNRSPSEGMERSMTVETL